MRKDRDCNTMYPIYPMPMQPPMMPMGMGGMPINQTNDNITNQINALEKRVSNLEAIINNTNYNTSGYQMM